MSRRDTVLVLAAALIIALLAWLFLAREKSDAPTAPPPPGMIARDPPLPEGRIDFSAGGTIYAVRPDDGALRVIIEGDRGDPRDHEKRRNWASSPSVLQDWRTLAFVRDHVRPPGPRPHAARRAGPPFRIDAELPS